MNFEQLIDETNDLVETYIHDDMEHVRADILGLDIRAGYSLWVNDDCIAVRTSNANMLDYYGGFEYVTETYTLGAYKFYSKESDRVQDCIWEWVVSKEQAEVTEVTTNQES